MNLPTRNPEWRYSGFLLCEDRSAGTAPPRRGVPALILRKARSLLSDCDTETRSTLSRVTPGTLLLAQSCLSTPEIAGNSVTLAAFT